MTPALTALNQAIDALPVAVDAEARTRLRELIAAFSCHQTNEGIEFGKRLGREEREKR